MSNSNSSSPNSINTMLPAALPVSTEDACKIIGVFMEHTPEIEFCVGNVEKGTISYSPKNIGDYYRHPSEQKAECERYLKEQKEKYPDGWITQEGYTTRLFEWYKDYNVSWDLLIPVLKKIHALQLTNKREWHVAMANNFLEWDIEDHFYAAYHFIKWYNENQPVSKR